MFVAAPAAPSGSISGRGASASWTSQQNNVIRIWNIFSVHSPDVRSLLPAPWSELPEEVLCTNEKDIYGKFAHFLLHVYVIEGGDNKGQHLRVDSATNYFTTAINLAYAKFHASGSAKSKLFFTCLNIKAGTQDAKWMAGIKKEITRVCFQRSMAAGDELDNSETPLYHHSIQLMIRALSREGSSEAADRKLALQTHWLSGGRSGEV
jgi:hypothetical protein